MLKFLTHKLRTHSLQDNASTSSSSATINTAAASASGNLTSSHDLHLQQQHDSGTESDEDNLDDSTAMESECEERSSAATLTPCSPYFLDSALPSDDHHSSEEELEVINKDKAQSSSLGLGLQQLQPLPPPPEKRKWSQVAALLAVEAASSSDDEVQGLLAAAAAASASAVTPVRFRTWPPLDAHRPGPGPGGRRSLSPPNKLFHYSSTSSSSTTTTTATSPRKRHRHHNTSRASHIQRPCLDFEKMQQLKARAVTAWRHGGDHGGELSVFCW